MDLIKVDISATCIEKWLTERRKVTSAEIQAFDETFREAVALNDAALKRILPRPPLCAADDIYALEVPNLCQTIVENAVAENRAQKSFFGSYNDAALAAWHTLATQIQSGKKAIAIAHTGRKLAHLLEHTLVSLSAEIELLKSRRFSIEQRVAHLQAKLMRAEEAFDQRCTKLKICVEASPSQIADALLREADNDTSVYSSVAEKSSSILLREAVTLYRDFDNFMRSDPIRQLNGDIVAPTAATTTLESACSETLVSSLDDLYTLPREKLVNLLRTANYKSALLCDLMELRAFVAQRAIIAASDTEPSYCLSGAPATVVPLASDVHRLLELATHITVIVDLLQDSELIRYEQLRNDKDYVKREVDAFITQRNNLEHIRLRISEMRAVEHDNSAALQQLLEEQTRLVACARNMMRECESQLQSLFPSAIVRISSPPLP